MTQYTDTPPFTGMIEIPIMAISGVHIYLDPQMITRAFPTVSGLNGKKIVARAERDIRREITVQVPGLAPLLHIYRRSRELQERAINVIVQTRPDLPVATSNAEALGWLCTHIAKSAIEELVNADHLPAAA